jgi:hypothetical protein
MTTKQAVGKTRTSSRPEASARAAALRAELTKYFVNNQEVAEHFWRTANPSLGGRSPDSLRWQRRVSSESLKSMSPSCERIADL